MNEVLTDPGRGCLTLVEILRQRAQYQPHRRAYTFLVDGECEEISRTYSELDLQARAVAAQLQSLAETGQRALLLFPPGLEFISAFMGCLYSGVIAVPVYPPHPARVERHIPRILGITRNAKPAIVLTTHAILEKTEIFFNGAPELRNMTWLSTDTINEAQAAKWQAPPLNSDTPAFLQYTSGSTTAPRGVMLNHGNLMHNERMIRQGMEQSSDSLVVGWLPLYHDMGLIGNVLQPLFTGYPCILMSPVTFLQRPFRWLQAISRFRATTSGGPNFAYDLCVKKVIPEQRTLLDLSAWELAFVGAEPINHETLERFANYFAPCGFRPEAFYPCYGLAEATLFVSGGAKQARHIVRSFPHAPNQDSPQSGDDFKRNGKRQLVGCGHTVMDQEIVIADPHTLIESPPGQEGEIWVAGPNVAPGYWNNKDETERVFQAYLANTRTRPFLRTGDLGILKDGELFVTGRIKDLVIIDGTNHYPQDIEWAVDQSHPALRAGCCAAFSIEADGREQLVIAAEVEPRCRPADDLPNSDQANPAANHNRRPIIVEEVVKAIRQTVSRQFDLAVYDVVLLKAGAVFKTSSGKVMRHACRAAYLNGSLETLDAKTSQYPGANERN